MAPERSGLVRKLDRCLASGRCRSNRPLPSIRAFVLRRRFTIRGRKKHGKVVRDTTATARFPSSRSKSVSCAPFRFEIRIVRHAFPGEVPLHCQSSRRSQTDGYGRLPIGSRSGGLRGLTRGFLVLSSEFEGSLESEVPGRASRSRSSSKERNRRRRCGDSSLRGTMRLSGTAGHKRILLERSSLIIGLWCEPTSCSLPSVTPQRICIARFSVVRRANESVELAFAAEAPLHLATQFFARPALFARALEHLSLML